MILYESGSSIALAAGGEQATVSSQIRGLMHVISHQATELASELSKERHYIEPIENEDGAVTFAIDPRFLIFEFITGFLLRKRQIELVREFIHSYTSEPRESSIHQMIMGQGKTQIICPLLSLMMADGMYL